MGCPPNEGAQLGRDMGRDGIGGPSRSGRPQRRSLPSTVNSEPQQMTVELEVFGALVPADKRRQVLHIDCGTTVQQVADRLGLNPDDIGLITIQGVQSELDDVMPPGSRLCIFPPMSGG